MAVAIREQSADGSARAVAATWSRRAGRYERFYRAYPENKREAWRRACRSWLGAEPRRVLDVGTGTGFLATVLAELGHDVVGVDLAEDMLPRAAAEARRRGVAVTWRRCAADRVAGLAELADPDGGVDVVTARYVLWTLPDPGAALAAWRRVLRPGGTLLVVDGLWRPRRPATPPPAGLRLRTLANRVLLGRHLPHWRGLEPAAARALVADAGFTRVQDVLDTLDPAAWPTATSVCALRASA